MDLKQVERANTLLHRRKHLKKFITDVTTSNLSVEEVIKDIKVSGTRPLGKYARSNFSIPLYADTLLRAVHEDLQTVNNLLQALNIDLTEEKQ